MYILLLKTFVKLMSIMKFAGVTEQVGKLLAAQWEDKKPRQQYFEERKMLYCRLAKQGDRRQRSDLSPWSAFGQDIYL